MAKGESFDDMIHRVQTRRVSNGQRGSRPGDTAMFQKATAPAASMSADPDLASEGSELAVSPAVSLGGGKKPSKSPTKRPNPFAGGKGFQKGGKGSFSRGGRY